MQGGIFVVSYSIRTSALPCYLLTRLKLPILGAVYLSTLVIIAESYCQKPSPQGEI